MRYILDYFFSDPDEIPEELLWHAYDKVHLIWLASIVLVCVISCIVFRRVAPEKQDKVLKVFAVGFVVHEIIKDLLHWYAGTFGLEQLPLHFCGISIMFSLWYAFRPNDLNGAYVYGMSFPGAICALLFPNWTNHPWWHFSSLCSFTIHAELVIFALMAVSGGCLYPKLRVVPKLAGVIIAMAIPIYFLNKMWGTNFMFISDPSPGSPLMPLHDMFGNGYIVAAFVLMVIVWLILFIPWEVYARKKKSLG